MTIEATRIPYDRVELDNVEVALHQEFEHEGENRILPFNVTVLDRRRKMLEKSQNLKGLLR